MDKKLIYGFLFATAMVGCTNEEFAEKQQAGDFGLDRPVIENFSFAVGQPETRMEGNDLTSWFTGKDTIGAVLVDYAKNTPYYQVVEGHVGNNRFVYNPSTGKFETVGTTVVGSWLFYASYDERMTTNRNGVKFDFPAVQMYSGKGYQEIAKMDFKTSPIVNLAGQEDGYFNYEIPMTSVYSYARITMKFKEPVIVQKLVIRPTDATGKKNAPFSTVYTIKNTKVPKADVYNPGIVGEQGVLDAACVEMRNRDGNLIQDYETSLTQFVDYLTPETTPSRDIIALNCLANTTESDEFDARMAIPAGKYDNLAVYAYTNKGVYKYDVNNANVAAGEDYKSGNQEKFLLRRQLSVALHNVNGEKVAGQKEYLEMTNPLDYIQLASTEETDGTVVISQEDLVAVINGINDSQEVKIRVLGDAVKINQDVMAALKAKLAVYPDAYLSFKDTDGQIEVVGNTASGTPLVLQNITFNGGAKLTSGYASVSENIIIPTMESFTVNAGSTLTFTTENGTYTGIENYGDVIFENTNDEVIAVPAIRTNLGTITINTPVKITTTLNNNMDVMAGLTGTIINNSTLDLNGTSTNNGMITNDGIINLTKDLTSDGEIVNNETINISSTLTNKGRINNNDGAILLVKGDATAALKNEGVITNLGDMYCHEGNNTINNTGEIYAKAGSTTYITTNSKADESTTATNNVISNKMGEIFCDSRNVDVSVTKANQKGYISYNLPADKTELTVEPGDKFNKVYLNGDCVLNHESVNFVVVEAEANVTLGSQKNYQEFTFNKDAFVYSMPEYKNQIAQLVVAEGVRVKVPTENAIGVYGVRSTTTWTFAQIINKGTILVGGEFWSQLTRPTTGTFASGDGQTSAFHWSETTWK